MTASQEQFPQSDQKIVETVTKSIPLAHIDMITHCTDLVQALQLKVTGY